MHASVNLGQVDVYVTAPDADIAAAAPTLANVPFASALDNVELPAGTYRVRVTVATGKLVAIDVSDVGLAAGQIRTLVAVDGAGGSLPLAAILLADEH